MKPFLVLTFFVAVILLSILMAQTSLSMVELVILGLATVRLARTLSFNTVADFIRKPFTKVIHDDCNAGDCVVPCGTGWRYMIGELLACPICIGTWSALVLLLTWRFSHIPVYVFAIAGLSEAFHWLFDVLEWTGRAMRCISGLISPDEHKQ
jgi:hypothetical protein